MTQEEKAKAYDEALKIAQCWLNAPQIIQDCNYTIEDAIQNIFQVLKESKDERIRKALVWHLNADVDFVSNGVTKAECIDYLEKQKEQKPVECIDFDNEFENQVSHLLASVLNGEYAYNKDFIKHVAQSLLGYAKNEMKPDEWDKREKLFTKALQTANAQIGQLFEENRKLKEQKPFNVCEQCPYYKDCPDYNMQKPVDNVSKEKYVKRFKALCDAYEIKLPNREYDIYHLCDELSKLSIDSSKQNSAEINLNALLTADRLASSEMTGRLKERDEILENPEKYGLQKSAENTTIKGGDFITDGLRVFLVLANVSERNLGETCSTFCESLVLGVNGDVCCDGKDFDGFRLATDEERARFIHDLKVGTKLRETPAEWSEEDEGELQNAIDALEFLGKKGVYKSESGYDAALQAASWLKDLHERFNLQSKQEWSEEDEKDIAHIVRILDDCYAYGKHDLSKTDHENLVGTLKSLRIRSKQSDTWKPSEEQMDCLCAAVDAAIRKHNESVSGYEPARILKSLYEQLKKIS